jgi:hypothetical protein
MEELCKNCRWWDPLVKEGSIYQHDYIEQTRKTNEYVLNSGLCRRYPPGILPVFYEFERDECREFRAGEHETASPVTYADEWCGEFKPKQ